MMKNILIISKDIYPLQNPRSFRTTELINELHKRGHKLMVLCAINENHFLVFKEKYPDIKVQNLGDITTILNHSFFQKNRLLYRILDKILYYFIQYPSIKLLFRVRTFLNTNTVKYDLLFTIANPFSIHWGAALAKQKGSDFFPKTWIADCGDPFMGNKITKPPFYFSVLEKLFCRKADVIAIPVEVARKSYYEEFHDKIEIIPQGFNFSDIELEKYVRNSVPTFVYAGVFYKGKRDPRPFLNYLCNLKTDFRFVIFTTNDSILSDYKIKLNGKLIIKNSIPRSEILKDLSKADFLVNIENDTNNQVPSKLIDYALSKRPIISLKMNDPNFEDFLNFIEGDYTNQTIIENIEDYNIKRVVDKFLEVGNN
jgi:glycosyltransferase involved in cell wall biosynthesis